MTAALVFGADSASAEKVLKIGTVGFLGMPIGDAIDQAVNGGAKPNHVAA